MIVVYQKSSTGKSLSSKGIFAAECTSFCVTRIQQGMPKIDPSCVRPRFIASCSVTKVSDFGSFMVPLAFIASIPRLRFEYKRNLSLFQSVLADL